MQFASGGNQSVLARTHVVAPSSEHTATVIFLHGLGGTGIEWFDTFSTLAKAQPHVKFLCPTAQQRSITWENMMLISSWYNIYGVDTDAQQDMDGLRDAADAVKQLIEEELKLGIKSERILLGGMSQGGYVALEAAFTYNKPLAGLVVLSCSLMGAWRYDVDFQAVNSKIPILKCQGARDDITTLAMSDYAAETLAKFNPNVTYKVYNNLNHDVSTEEIAAVMKFIKKRLPAKYHA